MNSPHFILILISGIIILDYIFWLVSNLLNEESRKQPLSEEGARIFDATEYAKSVSYGSAQFRVEFITRTSSAIVLLTVILFGGFAWLDDVIRTRIDNELLVTTAFVGILVLVVSLATLPIKYYSTFVIEERFGFNKSTKALFFQDAVKQLILSLLLVLPLTYALAWIYQSLEGQFWFYAWLLFASVSLFMFVFGVRLFLPMFNKLKPLPEGALRTAVEEYCQSQGFPLSKLYELDASKRSTKLNAFFSGMGKVKIIGLYDTLIEKLTVEESVAVLAHEVGHYKRKHIYWYFLFSNVQTVAIFALMGWLLGNSNLSRALGADQMSFHLGLVAFFILLSPVSKLADIVGFWLSRRNEYEADQYSIETYPGATEFMDSALRKLSVESLSNLNPHPLFVALNYTHPPILDRLAALK